MTEHIIFEDELSANFYPLTYTRPAFELLIGSKTFLEILKNQLRLKNYSLIVSPHLKDVVRRRHKGMRVNPREAEDDCMFINGLLRLDKVKVDKLLSKRGFIARAGEHVALAKLRRKESNAILERGDMSFRIHETDLELYSLPDDALIKYPWQLIEAIPKALKGQLQAKCFKPFTSRLDNVYIKGKKDWLMIEEGALIEGYVSFDATQGPIFISSGSEIRSFTRIKGPAYIGKGSVIKSALIGSGTVIGDECRIGGEVEHSVFVGYSNKAHGGFIGHSYVGEWVNIGAGACNSDLKNTYGTVKMYIQGKKLDSGQLKLGCFLADHVKLSIGSYIYTGKKVGVASQLHGIVNEDVPSFVIYTSSLRKPCTELSLDSAIRTQRRMMERRGLKQTEADVNLLKAVFELTKKERKRFIESRSS